MENVCTYKWLHVINDYPFPGESCGRKNVKLKLQFSTLINSMETGNQLLSFQSPHLGHTWGSLKELQLAWLSPELVTALRAFSLCYRAALRGGNNFTVSTQGALLLFFFFFHGGDSSVGECKAQGCRMWEAGTVLRGYYTEFLNTIYIICTTRRTCCWNGNRATPRKSWCLVFWEVLLPGLLNFALMYFVGRELLKKDAFFFFFF